MYIEIDGWDAGIKFSACHFIPEHGKCSRLHGHIYSINARIHGIQNEKGMLLDFIALKSSMRSIAEELDHRVLIPGDSKEMQIDIGDDLKIKAGEKQYLFPLDDVVVMDIKLTSAEELAKFVLARLFSIMDIPENINAVEVGVDEGKGQGAWARRDL